MRSQTKTTLAIAFCSLLLLRLAPSTAFAQTAHEIARTAFGSTVLLVMEDTNGQPLSLGSGFCVGNGELASNVHVIEGAVRGYANVVCETTKYDIEGIAGCVRDLV
jgi:S1-C subfamily serine protease